MTKYLILYRAPVSAREQMAAGTPEQAEAGMGAWMAWAEKAIPALVDLGHRWRKWPGPGRRPRRRAT